MSERVIEIDESAPRIVAFGGRARLPAARRSPTGRFAARAQLLAPQPRAADFEPEPEPESESDTDSTGGSEETETTVPRDDSDESGSEDGDQNRDRNHEDPEDDDASTDTDAQSEAELDADPYPEVRACDADRDVEPDDHDDDDGDHEDDADGDDIEAEEEEEEEEDEEEYGHSDVGDGGDDSSEDCDTSDDGFEYGRDYDGVRVSRECGTFSGARPRRLKFTVKTIIREDDVLYLMRTGAKVQREMERRTRDADESAGEEEVTEEDAKEVKDHDGDDGDDDDDEDAPAGCWARAKTGAFYGACAGAVAAFTWVLTRCDEACLVARMMAHRPS